MLIVLVRHKNTTFCHHCVKNSRLRYILVRTSDTTRVQARQLRHPKYISTKYIQTCIPRSTCVSWESTNVKCKKEAPTKSKRATQQFLCIFSSIVSSTTCYFLQSRSRHSSHWLTSLDRTEEENQVIGLRPQFAKNLGRKIAQTNQEGADFRRNCSSILSRNSSVPNRARVRQEWDLAFSLSPSSQQSRSSPQIVFVALYLLKASSKMISNEMVNKSNL